MKLFWTGTDSLMLVDYSMRTFRKKVYWWLFRRLVGVMDYFIEGHYCDSELVAEHVKEFGTKKPIVVMADALLHTEKYPKEPHDRFTVLYYRPNGKDKKFTAWLYGLDIIDSLIRDERLSEVHFLEVNGQSNMRYVFPYTDFYVRPNRHDGASRLRQECEIQDIPYYWTQTNPNTEDAYNAIISAMGRSAYDI